MCRIADKFTQEELDPKTALTRYPGEMGFKVGSQESTNN